MFLELDSMENSNPRGYIYGAHRAMGDGGLDKAMSTLLAKDINNDGNLKQQFRDNVD